MGDKIMYKKIQSNDPVELFQELCAKSEPVSAFIAVALDDQGLVSIGSMSLAREDIVRVLEQATEYLREKWNIDAADENSQEEQIEEEDLDPNRILH